MNNKKQIREEAEAIWNFELSLLLKTLAEKEAKWDKDTKRLYNKIKQKTYDILNPKREYE